MESIYKDSSHMTPEVVERLMGAYFQGVSIKVDWDFYATQKVNHETVEWNGKPYNRRTLVFGPWAGPRRCPTHVIHEMAHLAEINDRRILIHGWGLRLPEVYISAGQYSRMCCEPTTWQATQRETRVIAYQMGVEEEMGIGSSVEESVQSLVFMADWWLVPGKDNKERLSFVAETVTELRKTFTLERFKAEWVRKNALLKKRQYTLIRTKKADVAERSNT